MLVQILKAKSGTLSKFMNFKALAEKQISEYMKTLCLDHGGEYLSHESKTFCEKHGIQQQLIQLKSPQQNGLVEWKNHMLMQEHDAWC
jgi:transposase InsO family protein